MKTRGEHLEWAKERAYEFCDKGQYGNAWISFKSDMSKHDELKNHIALAMGDKILVGAMKHAVSNPELMVATLSDPTWGIRKFIKGFN